MNQLKIPTLSEKKILRQLSKRDYEDLELIADLEKNILRRRQQVISPFTKGENVILLLSGGLDSIAVWGILLKHYQLNVYPFYLSRKFVFGEEKSIYLYQRKFKNLAGYHPPYKLRLGSNFFSFKRPVQEVDPELMIKYFAPKMRTVLSPVSGLNFSSALYAAYYLLHLKWEKDLKVKKIVSGVTAQDGLEIYTQTQTFLRQLMLTLMLATQNNDLEIFSLGLEKNLGLFLNKSDFISLASRLGIGLRATHSCPQNSWFNCGRCQQCQHRDHLIDSAT